MSSIICIESILQNQRHRNYVAPITDGDLGWRSYFAGAPLHKLRNKTQKQAWMDAQSAAALHPSRFSQGDEVIS